MCVTACDVCECDEGRVSVSIVGVSASAVSMHVNLHPPAGAHLHHVEEADGVDVHAAVQAVHGVIRQAGPQQLYARQPVVGEALEDGGVKKTGGE